MLKLYLTSNHLKPFLLLLLSFTPSCFAKGLEQPIDLTHSLLGWIALAVFILSYVFVIAEDYFHLRKSKPVLMAAGLIWLMIGFYYNSIHQAHIAEAAFNHHLLEYAQLLLFLLVAMAYINAMEERLVFDYLRVSMIQKKLNLRNLFWITGILAFIISSFANNLTTAMLMCAIVLKMAPTNKRFINLSCINIVVASNAGGAFSPFGDITTLMIWQAGLVEFSQFWALFIPAVVNFIIPALIFSWMIPPIPAGQVEQTPVQLKRGAKRIVCLFGLTIGTAVACHNFAGLPAVLGMMMGLAYLKFFGFFLRKSLPRSLYLKRQIAQQQKDKAALEQLGTIVPFDVFDKIARAEWDTLLFFYGVVMCVGGLNFLGYLSLFSEQLYQQWNPTYANIVVGVMSAIVDNIPVMFAVINMHPDMDLQQWLLVTMTAGVGGSLLSVGSAAGVALMGQTRGVYSFMSHLKWSWVIAIGYVASIAVHLWLNS
ncbi:MAG: sodium:proton antiporter NhaD [Shewanellaceae bacterium]|nr:sodium:proton antiporter NhaD [Shewanellaceae bacterium]